MWNKIKHFIPQTRAAKLQTIILLVVLIFAMPNVIGWGAVHLIGASKLWIFLWLIALQVIWALIWYITYWSLRRYILDVILVRNLLMGLYFLSGIFVVLEVLDHADLFSLVITALGYGSMLIWYSYVFNHPEDSAKTSAKLHQFWVNHRKVNQNDVKQLIQQGNDQMKTWIKMHEEDKENADRVVTFYPDGSRKYR